jgi:hypothetical protein
VQETAEQVTSAHLTSFIRIDLAGLRVDGVGCWSLCGDGEVGQDRDRRLQQAGDLLDGVAVLLAGGA